MALHLVYALLAWQQSAQQPAPPPLTLPQPIARVDLKPGEYALQVGDTVRIHATAYDSSGQAMPQAVIRWFASGGRFEGAVDSTGLVSAGATGTLNVAAVATLPGRAAKSTVAFARITVLPQPAAKIAVTPRPERMLAGTSLVLEAVPYAANNDRRYDRVTWKSSRPGVVDVTPIGRVTARAPGRATLTAAGGRASESWTVVVTPNPVARVTLTPADTAIRSGDVVRFAFTATDATRRSVAETRPEWAVSPVGQGYATVDGGGVFVADQPGTYRVIATLARARRRRSSRSRLATSRVRSRSSGGWRSRAFPAPSCGSIRTANTPTCRLSETAFTQSTSRIRRSRSSRTRCSWTHAW